MNVQKWLAGLVAFVLFLSCSVYAQPAKVTSSSPKSNLLVSGQIVPIKNEAYISQGEVVFTKDAHAVVTLYHAYEGVSKLSLRHRIKHVNSFPISFHIEGNPEKFFARPGGRYPVDFYSVSATIYMGAGDEIYIGDCMTDILYQVDGPTSGKRITVVRLRDCNSPVRGACAEDERPQ